MCIVSNVSDYYGDQNPWRRALEPVPGTGPAFPWPQAAPATLPWTQETYELLKQVMEQVKKLDAKLGLPDCEDPKKAEWTKGIEARLAALEADSAKK